MWRLITTLLGFMALAVGSLILGRTFNPWWKFQLGLNELSWAAGFTGLATIIGGLRQRNFASTIFGLYGLLAGMWPFAAIPYTLITMEAEMQRGLGEDYALKIPQTMWPRLARYHWSLLNALGKRNYRSAATVTHDIVYAKPGLRQLRLDVYEPQIRPTRGDLYPAIIVMHPGSWNNYDKGRDFAPHHRYLASQGYVVFDIQYRLSQEALWPAPLDDVLCAIRWVQDHAADYNVDVDQMALMGRSAGGQLALRAAYDERVRVRAVIALYAPTDMRLWGHTLETPVAHMLGGTMADVPDNFIDASPVELVRDDLPPTLLITGMLDSIVPPVHAESLANRLSATNTSAVVLRLPWSRHAFDAVMPGLGAQVVQYNIDRFLAWSFYHA